MTRRTALKLGLGATWLALMPERVLGEAVGEPMQSLVDAVDHVLLGVADLDAGIAWLEQRTGVHAQPGGSHPGKGTRNALAAMGDRHYLEIIAPDPAQGEPTQGMAAQLVRRLSPALVTWAARATDTAALAARARRAGLAVGTPAPGSRQRPNGETLRWTTLALEDDFDGVAPFFISWSSQTRHPSSDAPKGLQLEELRLAHPRAKELEKTLRAMGIAAEVAPATQPSLSIRLTCPRHPTKPGIDLVAPDPTLRP
jgi:hypothetical protein